jgi:uncharacterized protein YdiU (UPF0061 family)
MFFSISKVLRRSLLLLIFLNAPNLWAQSLLDLVEGQPSHTETLGLDNFRIFPVFKLRAPQVLYINRDLLQEMGVNTKNLSEEEMRAQALRAFAWVSESSEFTTGQQRQAYSDFYGGTGMGPHKGSARAGILGQFQIKGIGLTPMHTGEITGHRDGSAGLHEGIKEVVWGEFLHRLLPFGANRVVALISTGIPNQSGEPGVLIVRQDPLRAGHFAINNYTEEGAQRERDILSRLPLVLNHHDAEHALITQDSKITLSKEDQKKLLAIDEWLYRLSQQLAKAHLQRVYHGAVSESNININGQFIDYGTASTNSGFGPIRFLSHEDPFGVYRQIQQHWGNGLALRFLKGMGLSAVDWVEKIESVFKIYLQNAMLRETLKNFGIPDDKIEVALKNKDIKKLATLLFKTIEYKEALPIDIQKNNMPKRSSPQRFSELLLQLVKTIQMPSTVVLNAKALGIDAESLETIRQQWEVSAPQLLKLFKDSKNPERELEQRIRWENRDRPLLYRNVLRAATRKLEEILLLQETQRIGEIGEKIKSIIEETEPRWKNMDLSRFVPIRWLRSNKNSMIIKVYDVDQDKVETLRISNEEEKNLAEPKNPAFLSPPVLTCRQIFSF